MLKKKKSNKKPNNLNNSKGKSSAVFDYDKEIEVEVIRKKPVKSKAPDNKKSVKQEKNKAKKSAVNLSKIAQKENKKENKKEQKNQKIEKVKVKVKVKETTSKPPKARKTHKPKKMKKKKSINTDAIKKVFKVVCITAIFIGVIIFLMISPVFNISEVEIVNNKKISKDTYISLSKIKYGTNIFRINKKEINNGIKENPYVESITISRKLPNKVVIDVNERTVGFMIKASDKYMYIDNQGYMLELSKDKLELPIITGIETKEEDIKENNRLCDSDLDKLNKVIEIYQVASNNDINKLITEIDISNKSNYKLVLASEKKNVYLGDGSDLVNKFTWIKKIIEDQEDEEGDIHANRSLNTQPVYFSPKK